MVMFVDKIIAAVTGFMAAIAATEFRFRGLNKRLEMIEEHGVSDKVFEMLEKRLDRLEKNLIQEIKRNGKERPE